MEPAIFAVLEVSFSALTTVVKLPWKFFNINVNKNKDSHSTTAAPMVHETGWHCRCWS